MGVIRRLGWAAVCRYGNCLILVSAAIYFFFIPLALLAVYLGDPGLKGNGVPRFAFSVHRGLAPRYERWARERIASGKAKVLELNAIAATEWPMFGSVFYLWATEALEEAWERDKTLSRVAPKVYAAGSIEAAAALVADPVNATWVKR